jgi:hypothetical protein
VGDDIDTKKAQEAEVEGHLRRANEEGPEQETDDPQLRDARRRADDSSEPDVEGHIRAR